MLLEGRIALVTGAARGIGRITALTLADEGADVGVADLLPQVDETAQEIRTRGRRATAVVLDIADRVQVREGVRRVREALGPIDILVNNAGIVNHIAHLATMAPEAWEREIGVNLTGTFHMIQEVIGSMVERKWGRIVNMSSLGATGGLHKQAAYAASKAGILGLTKTVTLEHARDGITCNAILPGLIGTELVQSMPEDILLGALSLIPARRVGCMEEVGHLVAFLASDRAGFINGTEIPVDGGMRLNVGALGSQREARGMRQQG
jgi:NAD(P)-dependent dehydrogenase (short-subunit alcohol dehydrogenase family)